MIFVILFLLSATAILFSIGFGAVITYHFKRFGLKDDPNIKRMMGIFNAGRIFFIGLNIVLFLFLLFKK